MTLIDKLGRKTLLLIGSVGTALCLAGVAEIFYTHASKLFDLAADHLHRVFCGAQREVIWVYIGEVFPNRVRSKGQALGRSAHWIMNAIIAYTFPQVGEVLRGLSIYVFCVHDGGAIFCGAVLLSGNQERHAGTNATSPGN